jgi:hypothetical protein
VSVRFFDKDGKRYKLVDQPNQKGPSEAGSFRFPGGKESFIPKVGKLKVSLFEKRGKQMQRLAIVGFDIGVRENDAVDSLPEVEKIMLKRGWERGAALQRRWLGASENQLVGKAADGKGTKGKLSIDNKTVTMDWSCRHCPSWFQGQEQEEASYCQVAPRCLPHPGQNEIHRW